MKTKLIFAFLFSLYFAFGCAEREANQVEPEVEYHVDFVGQPDSRMPVIYFSVVVKSGSADDPEGKEGLAWLTAHYLERGTESYSKEEISQKIASLGGRLDIRVDREVIHISARVLSRELENFYPVFREILLQPSFSFAELEALKADQKHALKQVIQNDARLCLATLEKHLYAGHPYEHPVMGLFSSNEKLTPEDAREFHTEHFTSANIICGLAGDYPEAFAHEFVDDLNSLGGETVERIRPQARGYSERTVIIVEKPGRDQAQIRIGKLLRYTRRDPVWYPLQIANSYLGRHREMFGRLFMTIREERGLSYGAYSYHEHFRQAGWSNNPLSLTPFEPQYFSIWTYPRRENTEFAIKMSLYELEKLITTGIEPLAMETVKSYEINHFPFLIEAAKQRLDKNLEEIYYELPGFIENYETRIMKQSSADVNTAVYDHWSSDGLLIVIVTDQAEKMKSELLSQQTSLTLPEGASANGLEEVNRRVKDFDLGLNPEDIVIIHADKLFR
ncbi:MAG: hypothetical protein GF404_11215 [candidate division Zixibacteria bacterium]|nr:hypothetical protein [candidate division Zixibacteria bacterium]